MTTAISILLLSQPDSAQHSKSIIHDTSFTRQKHVRLRLLCIFKALFYVASLVRFIYSKVLRKKYISDKVLCHHGCYLILYKWIPNVLSILAQMVQCEMNCKWTGNLQHFFLFLFCMIQFLRLRDVPLLSSLFSHPHTVVPMSW